MRLLALDLSLTGTGWAAAIDEYGVETEPGRLRGAERLTEWAGWLLYMIYEEARPHVAVIEGYSYASKNQAHQIGEWGGVARYILHDHFVPFVEIPPPTLKKYATGRGNAPKPDMRMELYKRSGLDVADDNAVDALWLLALGRQLTGDPLWDMPKANCEALAKVELPEGVTI